MTLAEHGVGRPSCLNESLGLLCQPLLGAVLKGVLPFLPRLGVFIIQLVHDR
jgi:hypothetical protein